MVRRIPRRRFLQRTAAACAAAGCGVWSQLPARASHAPHAKLNVAAIGVGNRGASNLAGVASENITALCDVDRRYLDAMAARFADARRYVDFRELLDQPDLDAVVISTPDHTHFHAAWLALDRGLHVYCEKPLAHSVWEVRQLAAAARQQRAVTQSGNQHHASTGYRQAAAIVQSGAIGPVGEVHAWTNRPIWPQGVERPAATPRVPDYLDWQLWLGPAPERPYHGIYHPRGWRGWWDFGCGALGDMGPHLLDPVFTALELTAPTRLSADSPPPPAETFPLSSTVRFEFPARGDLPALQLVWYDGDRQPPPAVSGVARLPGNGVLFLGERARMFVPEYGGDPIVKPRHPRDAITLPPPPPAPAADHYQEWLNGVRRQAPTSCDFEYGARLTETCLLGNIALRAGRPLQWDAAAMRLTGDEPAQGLLRRDYRAGWQVSPAAGVRS